MKRSFLALSLLVLVFLSGACDTDRVYQQVYDFDEAGWHMDTVPTFSFEIEDRSPKNVILHLRNSIAYEYQNVYITWQLEDSTGKLLDSQLIDIQLFEPKTGEPRGQGSSLYQHAVDVLKAYSFPETGRYTFKAIQYMRETELKEVVSVGLRVEQSQNK